MQSANQPVEIKQVILNKPGTSVCVHLRDNIQLTCKDILKWTPAEDKISWLNLSYDGQPLKPINPAKGIADEPFRFIHHDYIREDDTVRMVLRSATLVENNNEYRPCGVSFQVAANHDAKVIEVPDVKGRIFVGSIPIVDKNGKRPAYQPSKTQSPSIERMHAPLDLYVLKPGLIDLNIARNALIETKQNECILCRAGRLACEVIVDFYRDLAKNAVPSQIASRIVSEYWLCRLKAKLGLFQHGQHSDNDLECIEMLHEIWDALVCKCYVESDSLVELSIGEIKRMNRRVVFLWQPVCDLLSEKNYPFDQLLHYIKKELGEALIVTECGYDARRRFDPAEVFFSISRSIALIDPTPASLDLPPLLVFSLVEETDFLAATQRSAELFGSNKIMFGYWERSIAGSIRNGSNMPKVMVNLRANEQDVDVMKKKFLTNKKRPVMWPRVFKRKTQQEWLISEGVPPALAKSNSHLHISLLKQYPVISHMLINRDE